MIGQHTETRLTKGPKRPRATKTHLPIMVLIVQSPGGLPLPFLRKKGTHFFLSGAGPGVAAGLPGGFRRARIGPFGLRGDARGRCRSRRERIAKPATPRPVLRPLGIAQGQRCRTRRHLPGLPRTEHPPQPAGGPRHRMLGAVAQRVGDQLVAEPDVWLQHRPQRTRRRTAVAPARRGMRRMGGSRHAGVAS